VAEARDRYDLIVIDTPPVLAVADAPAIASVADGAIMVVRWRQAPAIAINSALATLQAYGVRILGGVVTQVRPNELGSDESGQGYLYGKSPRYFAASAGAPPVP
jgi:Mrp family chromosome partitioning ATPase